MYRAWNPTRNVPTVLRPPKWPEKLLELKYRRNTSNAVLRYHFDRLRRSGQQWPEFGHFGPPLSKSHLQKWPEAAICGQESKKAALHTVKGQLRKNVE
jgi:hypothetical protein